MDGEFRMRRLAVAVLALVAAVGIGAVAYQAGVAHGLALQVPAVTAPAAPGAAQGAQVPPYVIYPYRYWGPWRFGFFGPLLSIFFFFFVLRMLFWGFGGWAWRRRYWHYDPELGPPRFEEWHRRAHERMADNRGSASPGA